MNPIQRLFDLILRFVRDLVTALVGGVLRSPVTALEHARPELDIHQAQPSDVVDVRHAVLRPGRERTTAIWPPDTEVGTRHWVAEHSGRTIAVLSVMEAPSPSNPNDTLQLRGMAVRQEWQGKGVGAALLSAVMREVNAPMWCNARHIAIPFYERSGWTVTSETFEVEGIGPHKRMRWQP